jgi:hypothetical protein
MYIMYIMYIMFIMYIHMYIMEGLDNVVIWYIGIFTAISYMFIWYILPILVYCT